MGPIRSLVWLRGENDLGFWCFDVKTSKRQEYAMGQAATRATVYFDEDVHRALRLKAAASDRTLSDMVNEAVKLSLLEDAEDLAVFDVRRGEPSVKFEDFVKTLKQRGAI